MLKRGNFVKFCEEQSVGDLASKKPSGDMKNDKADYFDGLEDELGMDWKDIVTSLQGDPWVSSHFSLGGDGVKYKLASWEVVPGTMSKEGGADIRLKSAPKSYLKGNILNKGSLDEKRYHLSREQLIQFLTSGWTPAQQPAPASVPGLGF